MKYLTSTKYWTLELQHVKDQMKYEFKEQAGRREVAQNLLKCLHYAFKYFMMFVHCITKTSAVNMMIFKFSTSHFSAVSYFLVRCMTRTRFNNYVTIVHNHLIRTFFLTGKCFLQKTAITYYREEPLQSTTHLFKFKFSGHITNCLTGTICRCSNSLETCFIDLLSLQAGEFDLCWLSSEKVKLNKLYVKNNTTEKKLFNLYMS